MCIICFQNLVVRCNAVKWLLLLSSAVSYLASSSSGVSTHLVVRVVVTALESAPPDTAESSDSSKTHRSHILKPTPERRVEGDIKWEVVASEWKIHRTDRIIRARICVAGPERRERA